MLVEKREKWWLLKKKLVKKLWTLGENISTTYEKENHLSHHYQKEILHVCQTDIQTYILNLSQVCQKENCTEMWILIRKLIPNLSMEKGIFDLYTIKHVVIAASAREERNRFIFIP